MVVSRNTCGSFVVLCTPLSFHFFFPPPSTELERFKSYEHSTRCSRARSESLEIPCEISTCSRLPNPQRRKKKLVTLFIFFFYIFYFTTALDGSRTIFFPNHEIASKFTVFASNPRPVRRAVREFSSAPRFDSIK